MFFCWCAHHHQITKLSHSINAIGPAGVLILVLQCMYWQLALSAS
jgi:hypothetical protein